MTRLRIGYVQLTDAATVIAAATLGFAERAGLAIELHRENSWANVRDKLAFGQFEAAHCLAPLAIATSIGAGPVRAQLIAPFALNLNGNAVTVSRALAGEIGPASGFADIAAALGRIGRARLASGGERLSFAMVHAFSSHHYQLRLLLEKAGLAPERDVRLVVIPPVYMVDALAQGMIDGFCVGSPWNMVAVSQDVGRIVLSGNDIATRCPEKVLALPKAWAEREPALTQTLIRIMAEAADWCAAPQHLPELADLLARPEHLGLDPALVLRTLEGRLFMAQGERTGADPAFLTLGGGAVNRPEPVHALWLYRQMIESGQIEPSPERQAQAVAVYRPDLYDQALGQSAADAPAADPIGLRA